MDNPKFFQAFLNGVVRRTFFDEASITPQFLKDEIFSADAITVEELSSLFDDCAAILLHAAKKDVEHDELESALGKTNLSEMQQAVFLRLWRTQRPKIHDVLAQRSRFNHSLKNLSWRVDVKAKTKLTANSKQEINEPVAFAELVLGQVNPTAEASDAAEQSKDDRVVRIEMSREQLVEAVYQINQIQAQIEKTSGQ